jgi:alkylation response protein AidB-like acyl-CoA dehydrogenase
MHNLQLTDDQQLIVDTVRKFVADAVAPLAQELDEHRRLPAEQFAGLGELGLFGLSVAEDAGGAGMGVLPFVAALEAVGEHSGSLASLWISQVQCALALEAAGIGPLAESVAGTTACWVGPEHGIAFADGRLRGRARLVPAGAHAQHCVVAATAEGVPVLVVVPGSAVGRQAVRSLGLASAGCAALSFDSLPVSEVATGDSAQRAVARAGLAGLVGTAGAAVGGGSGAMAAAARHAAERIAFGKPLLAQEAVRRKLVDVRCRIDAARQLAWHAARLVDLGGDATAAAITARLAAVEAMLHAADEAIQIHGGFGYTVEYHVERHYRDAATLEVLGGGGEALRSQLAALQLA